MLRTLPFYLRHLRSPRSLPSKSRTTRRRRYENAFPERIQPPCKRVDAARLPYPNTSQVLTSNEPTRGERLLNPLPSLPLFRHTVTHRETYTVNTSIIFLLTVIPFSCHPYHGPPPPRIGKSLRKEYFRDLFADVTSLFTPLLPLKHPVTHRDTERTPPTASERAGLSGPARSFTSVYPVSYLFMKLLV